MVSLGVFLSPLRPIAKAQIIATSLEAPVSGPELGGPGRGVTRDVFEFQYWPETLTDSKRVDYAEKLIPGGSHPLYQWVRGGARTLSFTAVFVRERNPQREGALTAGKYVVDIDAAIWSLRRFLYPSYGKGDFKAFPPEFLTLYLPNTAIGGYDERGPVPRIDCIMTSANVEYRSWFPDGTPRFATVDLEFTEVVQGSPFEPADIRFVDRLAFAEAWRRYTQRQVNKPLGGI